MFTSLEQNFVAWLVVGLMGSLAFWTVAGGRMWIGMPILRWEPRHTVPWGLLDLLALLLIYLCGISVVQVVLSTQGINLTALDEISGDAFTRLIAWSSLANLAVLLLAVTYLAWRGARWHDLGVVGARVPHDIRLGFAGFLMLAPPVYLMQGLMTQFVEPEHPLITLITEERNRRVFYVAAFSAVIVAPVFEEFFFRVFLQGWLENMASLQSATAGRMSILERPAIHLLVGQRSATPETRPIDVACDNRSTSPEETVHAPDENHGESGATNDQHPDSLPPDRGLHRTRRFGWPIVVSAAVFALMHLGQGPAPIPLFLLALGLGYLYQRTHRVLPCIVVHLLINAMTLVTLWITLKPPLK